VDKTLLFIKVSEVMHGSLDLGKRMYIILTCATAGCAFGFSRAFLLLKNKQSGFLEGEMGVGPVSQEDANKIWCQMSQEKRSLEELITDYDKIPGRESMPLFPLVKKMRVPLDRKDNPLIQCLEQKKPVKIARGSQNNRINQEFLYLLETDEFVCIPLLANDESVGVLLADNLYSQKPISNEDVQSLAFFANQMGVAIEEAYLHRRLMENRQKIIDMERELRKSYVMASLGETSAYLAHEIRNPLVAIGGMSRSILKMIERFPELKVIKEKIEIIIREEERLEDLLSKTLDFAQMDELILKPGNINEIIEEICHLIEDELKKRNIELLKNLTSLPLVLIDGNKIKQVLFNLVQNSIESMYPGGGSLYIKTRKEENFIKIEIIDTGRGIPFQVKEKIFQPFFTTKTKGSGLGLAVVRRIVEKHRGYIKLESEENRGTSVYIYLPLVKSGELKN